MWVSETLSDLSADFQWVPTHVDKGQDWTVDWGSVKCHDPNSMPFLHRLCCLSQNPVSYTLLKLSASKYRNNATASQKSGDWGSISQLRTEINSCNLSLKVVHVIVSHAHTVPHSKELGSLDLDPGLQESQGFPEPERPCRNRPPATGYCDVRPCLQKLLEI